MKLRRALVILGLAGALAVTAVAGTAMAQTPTPGTQGTQTGTNYQEYFLDRLAAALGTTRDKLNGAFSQARNETADQAVKDGKLTQDQADRIKSQQGTGPFGFGFHSFDGDMGRGGKMGGPMGGSQSRDAIAGALGMTAQDMETQLRSGKTLAELAAGKEQAVKDAIVAAEKTQLDQAVKDGRITQDQENQRLDALRNADLNSLFGHRGMERGFGRDNRQAPAATPGATGGQATGTFQAL